MENTFAVALAGVIAQIFVYWAINVNTSRQTLRPNGQKYRFDPLRTTHEITSRFAAQLHRIFNRFSIAKSAT